MCWCVCGGGGGDKKPHSSSHSKYHGFFYVMNYVISICIRLYASHGHFADQHVKKQVTFNQFHFIFFFYISSVDLILLLAIHLTNE